jgi:hypothetical protein
MSAAARAPRWSPLRPGEILFIPAYWWHHVESVGLNLATSFWWTSGQEDRSRLLLTAALAPTA